MRRGTSSACAKRTHSSWQRLKSAYTLEDTSFARSRDPCTSIVTKLILLRCKPLEMSVARRSRYRGRENLRKQEEPATGSRLSGRMRGSPRVTASRGNSRGSCVMRKKRKVVMATVPASKRELGLVARTSYVQLQKSVGSILASNKLARSARKRVAVRVNGGLGGAASGIERSQGPCRSKRCLAVGLHPSD